MDSKTTTGTGTSLTTTGYHWKDCHKSPMKVFEVGKAHIYAADSSTVNNVPRPWALAMCCAGASFSFNEAVELNEPAKALFPPHLLAALAPPHMNITWPDAGIPRLTRRGWNAIVEVVKGLEGNVVLFCVGGHGRTGSALVILATLAGVVPKGSDPIAWLRARYCKDAVETDSQCDYIEDITGRKSRCLGSLWSGKRSDYGSTYGGTITSGTRPTTVIGPTEKGSGTRDQRPLFSDTRTTSGDSSTDGGGSNLRHLGIEPTAGGRIGRPIRNEAGDIVSWDFSIPQYPKVGVDPCDCGGSDWSHCDGWCRGLSNYKAPAPLPVAPTRTAPKDFCGYWPSCECQDEQCELKGYGYTEEMINADLARETGRVNGIEEGKKDVDTIGPEQDRPTEEGAEGVLPLETEVLQAQTGEAEAGA